MEVEQKKEKGKEKAAAKAKKKEHQREEKKRARLECQIQVGHLKALRNQVGDAGISAVINTALKKGRQQAGARTQNTAATAPTKKRKRTSTPNPSDRNPMLKVFFLVFQVSIFDFNLACFQAIAPLMDNSLKHKLAEALMDVPTQLGVPQSFSVPPPMVLANTLATQATHVPAHPRTLGDVSMRRQVLREEARYTCLLPTYTIK
jgi:hypothetical protein